MSGVGSDITKTIAKNASTSSSAVSGLMSKDNMPMFVIIGVVVLLFIFVILYITFAMKSNNLKGKALMTTPVNLNKLASAIQIPDTDIPKLAVGNEYSFSIWLYVENFSKSVVGTGSNIKPMHKTILYRGNAADGATANPLIMMDGQSNKVYFVIKTIDSSLGTSATVNPDLDYILRNNYFMNEEARLDDDSVNKHVILTLDYLPLQRWVNISLVVDNKIATIYMDGDIYSVKSTDEFKAMKKPFVNRLGKTVDYNIVIDRPKGDVFIGKSSVGNNVTIDGYAGKVEFFNYAISYDQAKKVYQNGPMRTTLLSKIGLGQYSVRSPIYKVNEEVQ